MTPREEIVGVVELVPRVRVVLATRLDGAACTTVVFAYPVKLALDAAVRDAMAGRGSLAGLPAQVAAALERFRPVAPVSAGVHRFALDGLVPLAGAFGNAYVTTRADADATIAVPDETIFVPDELPARAPAAALLSPGRIAVLALLFIAAASVGYAVTRALVS